MPGSGKPQSLARVGRSQGFAALPAPAAGSAQNYIRSLRPPPRAPGSIRARPRSAWPWRWPDGELEVASGDLVRTHGDAGRLRRHPTRRTSDTGHGRSRGAGNPRYRCDLYGAGKQHFRPEPDPPERNAPQGARAGGSNPGPLRSPSRARCFGECAWLAATARRWSWPKWHLAARRLERVRGSWASSGIDSRWREGQSAGNRLRHGRPGGVVQRRRVRHPLGARDGQSGVRCWRGTGRSWPVRRAPGSGAE